MTQVWLTLILILGGGCYYLFGQNQVLIGTNSKSEIAIEEQKAAIVAIQESYEKQVSVETDVGYVIMNQAFQATMVRSSFDKPLSPRILDLSERDITNLLILRKQTPYEEAKPMEGEIEEEKDILAVDFLDFDSLDTDELVDSIEDIWNTDLKDVDYYLEELLNDILNELSIALANQLKSELDKQNVEFFRDKGYGYDPTTRILLEDEDPNYHFQRVDQTLEHTVDLYLNNNYGYTLNLEQQNGAIYDYRMGVGTNTIDITQKQ